MGKELLKGKKGIIFGALDEHSIAWKVAERAFEEGASFTLTNAPVALRMGKINELGEKCGAPIIPADATNVEDIQKLFEETQDALGGKIDFILHSIGMSPNVRKNKSYTDLNYDWFMKTLDVSAISLHKICQTAMKMDMMNDWGSILGLSYIASQRTFPSYGDMAEAKSTLESIARSFGYHYGKKNKVRVNTISQSPTWTTAGSGVDGFDTFFYYADQMSPLGNASAESCADLCLFMFSEMSKMITMQNLYNDGGFSGMGVSEEIMEVLAEVRTAAEKTTEA